MNSPPKVRGSLVFIARGDGEIASDARNNAYSDALRQMGDGLGYDLIPQYLREFLGTGRIQSFGTSVSDSFEMEERGVYTCLLFVVTPEKEYYAQRSEEYLEMLSRQDAIDGYLDEALEAYKANRDGDALVSSLRALSESLGGPVLEERYEPESVLGHVMRYLSGLKLKTVGTIGTSSVRIRAKRDKGVLSPNVENMLVDAVYPMVNIRGEVSEGVIECLTDHKGLLSFRRTNPYMLRSGTITFRVHIPAELLDELHEKAPEGFLDSFLETWQGSSIRVDYTDRPQLAPAQTIISVTSVNTDGEEYHQGVAVESFREMLRTVGAGYYAVVQGEWADAEAEYQRLKETFPQRRDFILVRISVTDYRESLGETYVRADGNAVVINAHDGEVTGSIDSFAVASNANAENATVFAVVQEAKVAAGSIISLL